MQVSSCCFVVVVVVFYQNHHQSLVETSESPCIREKTSEGRKKGETEKKRVNCSGEEVKRRKLPVK